MDRQVRLFLHPEGSLQKNVPVDYDAAELWNGAITAVVRTEFHPKHPGARGQFENADYDVVIPSINMIPRLRVSDSASIEASTQVVIRIDRRGDLGGELFCIGKSPLVNVLDSLPPQELHEIDTDIKKYFSKESLEGLMLQYRAAVAMRKDVVVEGYQETFRSYRTNTLIKDSLIDEGRIKYESRKPKRPIDPFFYLSDYAIRPKREFK